MTPIHPVTILIVEDDAGHARLIEKNLRRAGLNNEFLVAADGRQALDILFSEGERAGRSRPHPLLVLLDLNIPVVDGLEVLRRMKSSPDTHRVPVIILTTTDDPREVRHCYDLGANVYIPKPVDYETFTRAVQELGMFISILAVSDGG